MALKSGAVEEDHPLAAPFERLRPGFINDLVELLAEENEDYEQMLDELEAERVSREMGEEWE